MSDWLAEEKPVNWVRRRAECTCETVLRALKYQFDLDIKEMHDNKHLCRGLEFKTEQQSRYLAVTASNNRLSHAREIVLHVEDTGRIEVQIPNKDLFYIMFKWNDEEAVCEFFIDDKPLQRWQISQRVLTPLLFGDRHV